LLHLDAATVVVSAVLVGSSIFITPSAMAVLARQELPPPTWAKALMFYTVTFSVGQAAGSWASGWLAERFSLDVSLGAGGLGLVIGAAIAWLGSRARGVRTSCAPDRPR
jgi:predicted MFS family arabinose efflux permease